MNAATRRERLIRILAMCGKTPVRVLAERLGVSERTIFRDVDALSDSEPISIERGRYGGVFLTDTYALNRLYLKNEEILLLQKIEIAIIEGTVCTLEPSERELLNEIISFYSKPKYVKGKRI